MGAEWEDMANDSALPLRIMCLALSWAERFIRRSFIKTHGISIRARASVRGDFSAAAISNFYYPSSDRGGSLVLFNGLAGIGAEAAGNLIREFVLKRFTSHVPKQANGQP